MNSNLHGKRILVTGGTSGIGFALARALNERGARVFICGRDRAGLDDALAALPGVRGAVVDLVRDEDRHRLIFACETELGGLDAIVHNAGIQQAISFTDNAGTDAGARALAREIDVKASQGKPVEVDEKREVAELQKRVASNDRIKAMLRAETDYLDMMRRINQAIDRAAAEAHGVA